MSSQRMPPISIGQSRSSSEFNAPKLSSSRILAKPKEFTGLRCCLTTNVSLDSSVMSDDLSVYNRSADGGQSLAARKSMLRKMDFATSIVAADEDICVDEELEEEEARLSTLAKMDLGCFCGVADSDVLEGL